MDIPNRLKTERERVGLTQTELAESIKGTKRSVINWEGGAAAPPATAIASMDAVGLDVLYILTGRRSQAVAEVALLPADERALVEAYRRCNADARRNLIQTAALLSAGMGAAPSAERPSSVRIGNMNNNTPGAVQVGYAAGKVSVKRR